MASYYDLAQTSSFALSNVRRAHCLSARPLLHRASISTSSGQHTCNSSSNFEGSGSRAHFLEGLREAACKEKIPSTISSFGTLILIHRTSAFEDENNPVASYIISRFTALSVFAPGMSSALLKLPAELRNQIWQYALASDTRTLRYDSCKRRFDVSNIGAGLLTTCRSICRETLFTPLYLNTLIFSNGIYGNVDMWILLAKLERLEQCMEYSLRLELSIGEA